MDKQPTEIANMLEEVGSRMVEIKEVRIPELEQKIDEILEFFSRLETLLNYGEK